MRVRLSKNGMTNESLTLTSSSIVEYATRDEAQRAVEQLSNQNLMGRLVYVREVRASSTGSNGRLLSIQ